MNIAMKTLTAVIVLGLGTTPLCSWAQGDTGKAADEVTAVGERSPKSLRAAVLQAEDAVYGLFNDLNDDDAYDVVCKNRAEIGSQIPQRVCLPKVLRDFEPDDSRDGDARLTSARIEAEQAQHQRVLREKMLGLASEHPELMQALQRRYALAKRLAEAQAGQP
jgi:hypothetical protein